MYSNLLPGDLYASAAEAVIKVGDILKLHPATTVATGSGSQYNFVGSFDAALSANAEKSVNHPQLALDLIAQSAALVSSSGTKARLNFLKAKILMDRGDYDAASELYTGVVQSLPQSESGGGGWAEIIGECRMKILTCIFKSSTLSGEGERRAASHIYSHNKLTLLHSITAKKSKSANTALSLLLQPTNKLLTDQQISQLEKIAYCVESTATIPFFPQSCAPIRFTLTFRR